jgi:hypothetical protein
MAPRKKKEGEAVTVQKRVSLLKSIHEERWKMYRRYFVAIVFRDRVLGGIPVVEKLLEAMLRARVAKWQDLIDKGRATAPAEGTAEAATIAQIEALRGQVDLVQETEESWCSILRDEVGYYFEPRYFKAMLKVAGNGLGITKRTPLGCKQDLQHFIQVKPVDWKPGMQEKIYFLRDGKPIPPKCIKETEEGPVELPNVDGSLQRAIQVDTRQGPRSALVKNDYFQSKPGQEVRMEFEIWVLHTRHATAPDDGEMVTMMCVSEEEGLGASRSQGFGKFDTVEFDRLPDAKLELPVIQEDEGGLE